MYLISLQAILHVLHRSWAVLVMSILEVGQHLGCMVQGDAMVAAGVLMMFLPSRKFKFTGQVILLIYRLSLT